MAKELIANSVNCSTIHKGIITFGDGDACEKLKNCSDFGSFFEGYLVHYKSLVRIFGNEFATSFYGSKNSPEMPLCGTLYLFSCLVPKMEGDKGGLSS